VIAPELDEGQARTLQRATRCTSASISGCHARRSNAILESYGKITAR